MKKAVIFFLSLLILAALPKLVFLAVKPRILALTESMLSASSPGEVRFSSLRNTHGMIPRFEIRDVTVRDPETQDLLLKTPLITLTLRLESLWKGKLLWKKISLDQPQIYFQKKGAGKWEGWDAAKLFSVSGALHVQAIEAFNATLFFRENRLEEHPGLVLNRSQVLLTELVDDSALEVDAFGSLEDGRSYTVSGLYHYEEDRADITVSLGEQQWMFEGAVQNPSGFRTFEGTLSAAELPVGAFLSYWGGENAAVLDGEAVFQGEGQLAAQKAAEIPGALLMKGALDVRNGHFLKINFLREALSQALAGANEKFENLSLEDGDYSYLFVPKILPFELLQGGLEVLNSQALVEEMIVKHSDYLLEADATYGLESQELELRGRLVLLEPLSEMLVKVYPALSAFMNPQKRLVFSFVYRGLLSAPVFQLEENYVKTKIAGSGSEVKASAGSFSESIPAEG